MRKQILISLLFQISLNSALAFSRSLIVAPDGPTATLYVNAEVGTTVEFPGDIKLITPRKYYVTEKQGAKYLYITAKVGAIEEPVSVIISGGRKLFFTFVSSKNAHRLVTVNLVEDSDKKLSRQEKIVVSAVTGKAIPGVRYQAFSGQPVYIGEQKLRPFGSYHLPPYIGLIFEKDGKSEAFDHKKTSLGPQDGEVWSADLGNHVMWIVENRQAFSMAQLMRSINSEPKE